MISYSEEMSAHRGFLFERLQWLSVSVRVKISARSGREISGFSDTVKFRPCLMCTYVGVQTRESMKMGLKFMNVADASVFISLKNIWTFMRRKCTNFVFRGAINR